MPSLVYNLIIDGKDQTGKAFGSIEKRLSGVTKAAGQLALGIAGAGAGLAAFAVQQIEVVDGMAKAAKAADVSAESLQELRFAAERSGASAQQLDEGLRRMTRRLGLAAEGGGPAAATLDRLGISAVDAAGNVRATEDVLTEFIGKMEGVESQATIAAEASALFGDDAGPKLALLLAEGAEGIANLREEARALGVVSNEQAAQAEAAADAFSNLGQSTTALSQTFALEFAPALTEAAQWLAQHLPRAITTTSLYLNEAGAVVLGFAAAILEIPAAIKVMLEANAAFIPGAQLLASAIGEIAEAATNQAALFDGMAESMRLRAAEAARELAGGFREVGEGGHTAARGSEDLESALIPTTKELEEAAKQAQEYEKALQGLIDKYDPLAAKVREAESDLSRLVVAFANGEGDVERLARAVGQAVDTLSAVENEFAEVVAGTIPIIDSTFGDITSILEGTVDEAATLLDAIGTSGEESAARSKAAWLDFFTSILEHDGFGALNALFQTELVVGGFDENGNPTDGLLGAGGQLSQGGMSAFSGAAAGLSLYEQGATTGQVILGAIGAAIGGYYGGAAGAQFGAAVGSFIGGIVDPAEEGESEIRTSDAPFSVASTDSVLNSPFGDVFIRSGSGGFINSLPQATRQMRQFFSTIEGLLSPDQLEGVTLPSLTRITTSDVASGQFLKPFLESIVGNLDPVLRGLVGPIDDVAQSLERLSAAVRLFDSAFGTDAVTDVMEEFRKAGLGMADSVREVGAEAVEAAQNFTGTVSSMNAVSDAVDALHESAANALRGIRQAADNVRTITTSSVDQLLFMRVGSDPAAQMAFLTGRANALSSDLAGATTAEEVQRLVESINAITLQAVNLNPTEANIDRSIEFLREVEANAQAQLKDIEEVVISAYDHALQGVRDLIEVSAQSHAEAANVVGIGADRIWDAGNMIQKGGEDIMRAAQLMLDMPGESADPVKPTPIVGPSIFDDTQGNLGGGIVGTFGSATFIPVIVAPTAGPAQFLPGEDGAEFSPLGSTGLGLNRGQLIEAVNREIEILTGSIDGLGESAGNTYSILDTINGLLGSLEAQRFGNLSPLTVREQFAQARSTFDELAALALGGDQDAANRLGGARDTLLGLGQQMFTTASNQYADLFFGTESVLLDVVDQFGALIDPIDGFDLAIESITDAATDAVPVLDQIAAAIRRITESGGSTEGGNNLVAPVNDSASIKLLSAIDSKLNVRLQQEDQRDVPLGKTQRHAVAMET